MIVCFVFISCMVQKDVTLVVPSDVSAACTALLVSFIKES